MRHFVTVGGSSLWFRASLSRGGGFCPPRAITRGQVVIGTPHWRNKRGAAHTSSFWVVFAGSYFVFAPRTRPNRADFLPREAARETEQKSHAWRRTPQNEIAEFGPARWAARKPWLAPLNRRAAGPSAVRSRIIPFGADLTSKCA